jgi:ABC-type xylose transport system permease subunit
MKRRTSSYILATVFWLLALLFGWLAGEKKGLHWGMFILWVVSITFFYVMLLREFRNRNRLQ